MLPIDELLIERGVRHPETLDAASRHRLARYLRASDEAADVAAFYRSFYAALDEIEPHAPPVCAFVDRLFAAPDGDEA